MNSISMHLTALLLLIILNRPRRQTCCGGRSDGGLDLLDDPNAPRACRSSVNRRPLLSGPIISHFGGSLFTHISSAKGGPDSLLVILESLRTAQSERET
jgi:hypothetical protein